MLQVGQYMPKSCNEIQRYLARFTDAEYCVNVASTSAFGTMIYCHNMSTSSPQEFLTLPMGRTENHVKVVHADTSKTFGEVFFDKIRLDIQASV